MPEIHWRRITLRLLMMTAPWVGAGCGESPQPVVTLPVVMDSNGPPSAAAADVKNPTTPPTVEPTYSRPAMNIDYGPSSAASADAAKARGR
jgi:hypothetical protein